MKKKILRKSLAFFLTLTMLCGQVMTSIALAQNLDEIPDFEESDFVEVLPPEEDEIIIPSDEEEANDEENEAGQEDDADEGFDFDFDEDDFDIDNLPEGIELPGFDNLALEGGQGGLVLLVTPPDGNPSVKDGDIYTFNVDLYDTDLETLPNIVEGSELVINLPSFLTSDNFGDILESRSYFKDYRYDRDTNTLTFIFADPGEKETWVSCNFNITTVVDTIGYDGDGRDDISINMGGTDSGDRTDVTVDIKPPKPTGTIEDEPYIQKVIWSNYKPSEYGVTDYVVVRDDKKPIGYSVAVGINNTAEHATFSDDLSNGNLTLCDVNGNMGADIGSCVQVYVGGQRVNNGTSSELGTVEIVSNGTGFDVNFSNPGASPEQPRIVDVEVRYYARLTGSIIGINNSAGLRIDNVDKGSSSNMILRREDSGLMVKKTILYDGVETDMIRIYDAEKEITFRISMMQIGNSPVRPDGWQFVYDLLDPAFIFNSNKVTMNKPGVFRVEQKDVGGQVELDVVKDGDGKILAGDYIIDFTVDINYDFFKYGATTTNAIGNSITIIRRPAKITLNKTWIDEADKNKGAGARFELFDSEGSTIDASGDYSNGNEFTIYFWADLLKKGTANYFIREYVSDDSDYISVKDIPVVMNRDENDNVTIISIGDKVADTPAGDISYDVENQPDSGLGSIEFRKYGDYKADNNLIDGGHYALYRVTDTEPYYELVERFQTENGVYSKDELPYGTYYIVEEAPPPGYIINTEVTVRTGDITIKKTAPHGTADLTNEKYRDGKILIYKKDDNSNKMENVSFRLTGPNNYDQTRSTNSEGYIEFTGLEAGSYNLTENIPYGYTGFDGSYTVVVDETGEAKVVNVPRDPSGVEIRGNVITFNWTNTQLFGSLKIVKYGEEQSTKLENAAFELYNSKGAMAGSGTTNNKGELEFNNLPYDNYTLKEITPPTGYVISDELARGISVQINTTTQIQLPLQNRENVGRVNIIKKDVDTEQNLSGAIFGLFSERDDEGSLIKTATTDNSGHASFNDLKSGTYYIKETKAPTGYQLNTEVFEFKIGVVDGVAEGGIVWQYEQTVTDAKKLYKLELIKANEAGDVKLAGASFTLTGNGLNLTAVSENNGRVLFENIPYGTYTITETVPPTGYVPAEPITVTISDDNTLATYQPNQIVNGGVVNNTHTRLTVLKVDDKDGSKGLPDTVFTIMHDGQYVTASGENGVYTFTGLADEGTQFVTATGGIFTLEYIPMGDYTLHEVSAPDGYIISQDDKNFTIVNANSSVTVGNTQIRAAMKLLKTDEHGKLLAGIGFTIETATGSVQASGGNGVYSFTGFGEEATIFYTDANGIFKLDNLLWGIYTINEVESTTPSGLIPQKGIQFTVDAEQHEKTIDIDVENKRYLADMYFSKVDEDNQPLEGAVFSAICISGTDYSDTEVRYAVSNREGVVTFRDVPYGVYKVQEYLAPYGKELNTNVYYLSAGGAEAPEGIELTVMPLTVVNQPIEVETVFKKVSSNGKPLVGMVFDVTDSEGKPYYTDISIEVLEGKALPLPIGDYLLIEKTAPANHIMKTEPVPFKVTLYGKNEVVVENDAFTGSLTLHKSGDDGSVLAGAEFSVFDKADYAINGFKATEVCHLVTDANGEASVSELSYGSYTVVEVKAPKGYELNSNERSFTIDENEDSADISLDFVDEKSHYVFKIYKKDIHNQDSLIPGASFIVYGENFHKVVTTGEDGTAIVEVPTMGTYYVLEVEAPEGYTIDPTVYTVEINEHTAVDAVIEVEFVSLDYTTQLQIIKQDENGEALDGAIFALYNSEGNVVHLTGADGFYSYDPNGSVIDFTIGEATITKLPIGTYTLKELSAPAGYVALEDIKLELSDSNYDKPVVVYAQNFPQKQGVAVCKEDVNGIRLKGAEFTLYDAQKTPIKAVTTTASGYAYFGELLSGSYYIQETGAPAGYALDETLYSFTIHDDGNITGEHFVSVGEEKVLHVLKVVDESLTYGFELLKTSAVSGKRLNGAVFRILGNGVNKTFTSVNGVVSIDGLEVGNYMLTEIEAPEGYELSNESHLVTVTTDGILIDGEAIDDSFEVTNKPLDFKLAIVKRDEDTDKPLEGAAFTITATTGEKYYLITDAKGETDSVTLKPGTYAITETIAPKGYNIPLAGWTFTLEEGSMRIINTTGHADYHFEDGLVTVTLTNKRTSGSLIINKLDAEDNEKPLANAQFKIEDENGNRLWFTIKNGIYNVADASASGAGNIVVTNAMGQVVVDGLGFGRYTLTEISAPEGYKIVNASTNFILLEQDETVSVTVENEPLKRIVKVVKVDAAEPHDKLLGAVFSLYTVKDGEPDRFVAEGVSLYNGEAQFEVPFGDYMIVETKAPLGFEPCMTEPVFFSYNADTPEDEAFVFTFENEKTHYSISALKVDSVTGEKLVGAKFAFTNSLGYTKVVETGADGIAMLDNIAYDDYTIREIEAPKGYFVNEEVFKVSKTELKHNASVVITVEDRLILGKIHLKKVDLEATDKILDADFVVTDSEGNELKWTAVEGGYTLSEEGETVIHAGDITLSNIPEGKYTLTEVKAPDGYLIVGEEYPFEISAANADAGIEITVKNLIRKLALGILKYDSKDKQLYLEGAEFTIYPVVNGVEGKPLMTQTSDENGRLVFTDLTMGEYVIRETKAPYGYKLWEKSINVKIDADGNVKVGNSNLPELEEVYMMGVSNESITKEFSLKKIDADTKKPLEGAIFKITDKQGKQTQFTSGKDGLINLKLTYGEYELQEIVAPDGYVLSDVKHPLIVSEKGVELDGKLAETAVIELSNEAVLYPLSIHKQDSVTGRDLRGAEFTIKGDNVDLKLATNASGNSDTIYLRAGVYTITETKAPDGHKLPLTAWTLTVARDGKMTITGKGGTVALEAKHTTLTLENEPTTPPPPFTKTGESNTGSLLAMGITLMLASFTGLVFIANDDKKRKAALI